MQKNSNGFNLWGGLFFAGANSAQGFVSFYDEIINDKNVKRVYILKGGPGTGKSSFLRSAAAYALQKGRNVEFYSCSSDPDSLDAVLIDGEIVILDGTAPHAAEPKIAGAREEIINLGSFWDSERLARRYEEISTLSRAKSESYKRAYRYIGAHKNINDINMSLVMPFFKTEKAERAVERTFSELELGGGFELHVGVINSLGMKGRVRYDTYERFASKVYVVDDFLSTAHLYLRLLLTRASLTDTPVRVSYNPIDVERPDALYFINDRKAFVVSTEENKIVGDERINMRRFVSNADIGAIRKKYKSNKKLADSLIISAEEALVTAGECHFALEEIYTSCMDFAAKEEYSRSLIQKIIL